MNLRVLGPTFAALILLSLGSAGAQDRNETRNREARVGTGDLYARAYAHGALLRYRSNYAARVILGTEAKIFVDALRIVPIRFEAYSSGDVVAARRENWLRVTVMNFDLWSRENTLRTASTTYGDPDSPLVDAGFESPWIGIPGLDWALDLKRALQLQYTFHLTLTTAADAAGIDGRLRVYIEDRISARALRSLTVENSIRYFDPEINFFLMSSARVFTGTGTFIHWGTRFRLRAIVELPLLPSIDWTLIDETVFAGRWRLFDIQ